MFASLTEIFQKKREKKPEKKIKKKAISQVGKEVLSRFLLKKYYRT